MRFEVARVPQLSHKLPETLHQQNRVVTRSSLYLAVVRLAEEEISQRADVAQKLENNIAIVVSLQT